MRELQLATLVDAAPDGDDWLHEQKFDGYRILAERSGTHITLFTRNGKDWTSSFPTIRAAVAKLPVTSVTLDGEAAALLPDGRTSFQALQGSFGDPTSEVVYFVFDLLELDGEDIAALPLDERKARLAKLVAHAPAGLRYSDHVVGRGAEFFALACQRQLEGIVSKRRDRRYTPGRNTGWVKTKCLQRQELVIGGFTEPEGGRRGLGALLVGVYAGDTLHYAGKVGTGFSSKLLVELRGELDSLEVKASPFSPEPSRAHTGPRVHWVRPELVAEVAFAEWTGDGRLRHPSFQGMRRDKPARSVVREAPRIVTEPKPKRARRR
ncbi:MAG TPA: non-homologous end-joining DNA ligase [Kofleriaceae bacterium]|nr:non-homologous end-joining DNA ligase [Kofleriaceae bacterium]